jgi:fructose-1,6-bisphosphatase
MTRLIFLILLLHIKLSITYAQDLTLDSIDQLRWNSRVILVKIDNDDQVTLSTLKNASNEISERDINWFAFSGDSFYSNYENRIGRNFQAKIVEEYFEANKNIVLLGKDGYVKLRSESLELDEIFDLIDSMPMRQMEMSSQSE